ncbi:thioesterase II family protein [Bradyrhizobium sp.]|jgi:surfactin synthase thioesterase subunit|uniref:thioesterase II family protein n=1 Tax=Bradyrhizobium sp. TaxID=376 RepID=UPI002E017A8C|nr:alpha/beta fold hydrolase [Bradyrhizobium sp.]
MPKSRHSGTGNWIRNPPREDSDVAEAAFKLICFHHGGGGASSFNGWYRLLPPSIDMFRVQLPGREDRLEEGLIGNIDGVLRGLVPQLAPLLDGPTVFYGHSLGAIVAFEAVRRVRRDGHRLPEALFVSGRRAPHLPLSHAPFGLAIEDDLIGYLASMGGMPDALLKRAHWRNQLFPIVREDLNISDLYVYRQEAPLPCPITFFAGGSDPWVKPAERQDWQVHTASKFRLIELAGGHFFSREEQAIIVAEIIGSLRHHAGPAAAGDSILPEKTSVVPEPSAV